MDIDKYQAEMRRTYKPERLLNHILGLCGEAGEVADAIKKAHFHGVAYELAAIKKELGDVLWYVAALAEDHGLTLSEIAKENVEKLRRRYPDGFVSGGGVR
jgi:NTP pyrophosphatase (non-canonical NTP hydrolase)